jgi:acetyl-CoA carboxylase biotin carboxyl carrier protein
MHDAHELRVERDGTRVRLLSPDVGLYTSAHERGALVASGTVVGSLTRLGVRRSLVVPDGVEGRVASEVPERAHHPLGYGDLVIELEEIRGASRGVTTPTAAAAASADGRLVLRATTSGRFWHRPAPGEPAFVAIGTLVKDGSPVGLLEVMKTFSHANYRAQHGLPREARVLAMLAADGADVRRGDALLAVEAVS